jgi:hypothetical protein
LADAFYQFARVERSLYERANGYNYTAVKVFMPAGSKQPIVVHYTEHCPPDVGAAFIWLKNRDPERWRDVPRASGATTWVSESGLPGNHSSENWLRRACATQRTWFGHIVDDTVVGTKKGRTRFAFGQPEGVFRKGETPCILSSLVF